MVLVSVVMASYNHEKYVGAAIESVLNQTFSDLELVIVDDASSDASPDIIRTYSQKDPRLHTFFHKTNLGIARTMNDCLKEAKGTYIGFIGSDDTWLPQKLEQQLELMKGNEDKILWSNGQVINSQGVLTGQVVFDLVGPFSKKSGNLFQELLIEDFIFGQSALFKTSYAQEIGFDEEFRFVNDHLFFINLAKKHDFLFDPQPLAQYRVHEKNTTALYSDVWFKERIMMRNKIIKSYRNEISPHSLADIYYKLGHAYDGLGNRSQAKYFYLKALRVPQFRANSLLYLLAIGNKGFVGAHLESTYKKLLFVLANHQQHIAA